MSFLPKKTGQILLKDGVPKQFEFSKKDIVRDEIVSKIIDAYENHNKLKSDLISSYDG